MACTIASGACGLDGCACGIRGAAGATRSEPKRLKVGRKDPLLTVRCSHFMGWLQLLDHRLDALGKAFRIEIQRIVVAVRNIGVERGMIGRNEPMLRAHARNHVEESRPVVLRGRESRIGALRIVVAAVSGSAPRLNQLDMQEETFQRAGEIRRLLEFGLAPGNFEPMVRSMSPERLMTTCALPQPSEHLNLFRR